MKRRLRSTLPRRPTIAEVAGVLALLGIAALFDSSQSVSTGLRNDEGSGESLFPPFAARHREDAQRSVGNTFSLRDYIASVAVALQSWEYSPIADPSVASGSQPDSPRRKSADGPRPLLQHASMREQQTWDGGGSSGR